MKVQKKKKGERKTPISRDYKAWNYTKNIRKHKVIIYRAYKIKIFEVKAHYTNLWGGVPILIAANQYFSPDNPYSTQGLFKHNKINFRNCMTNTADKWQACWTRAHT